MIYIAGISIAFFLTILLLTKKGKTQADYILTCWLMLMGMHLLLFYLFISGISYQYPWTLGLSIPLPLVHGPMLFLYTASVTNQLTNRKVLWLLHFIPPIACWLYLLNFYLLPGSQKVFIFQNRGVGFENFMMVNLAAIIISGITYVSLNLMLLSRHRRVILDQFSFIEKINLSWLRYLIYGIAFIWLLIFAKDEVLFAGVVVFIFFMGYYGLRQPGIFTNSNVGAQQFPSFIPQGKATVPPARSAGNLPVHNVVETGPVDSNPVIQEKEETAEPGALDDHQGKRKYLKSGLSEVMADQLHRNLTRLMDTDKVYTESELSLSQLANRLSTLPNYLSQVINEKEGKTFYDYINNLRIEEFKRTVADPGNKKYKLMSLSYDCGFNSKSSFNKNFKKATGMSPSEYLDKLNLEKA